LLISRVRADVRRWTADSWKTYEDVHCSYLPSGAEGTSVVNVFDTFHFSFKVPKAGKLGKDGQPLCRLDFCVCFRADSGEFWDNNKGSNFVLAAPPPKPPSPPPPSTRHLGPPTVSIVGGLGGVGQKAYLKTADALRAEVPSWSEFASWNHLTNDAPYW
jgi:protein phosphatase 1 regulatory subunit 3A/B/C/D/E